MGTRRVVDRVPATARRAAFQRAHLVDKLRMIQQLDLGAVESWEKIPVEIGLRPIRWLTAKRSTLETAVRSRRRVALLTPFRLATFAITLRSILSR